MNIGIISIFPEMFNAITKFGITKKAIKNKLLKFYCWNPRKFTNSKNFNIDDRPYGGGPGMLMKMEPLQNAINYGKKILSGNKKIIYLTPQGKKLNFNKLKKLINIKNIILVCGRYEGIDERLIISEIDEEISIGDYILSGGELAAMILIDSITRFIPGVLQHKLSSVEDSFENGLLDYPSYTRPRVINKIHVPNILLNGNHKKIYYWRLKQSLGRTWIKRPDLLKKIKLTNIQKNLLNEFKNEYFISYKEK
ncbi:tRNA (guanosine(37)-N1)-methyltransferase TrmD [Sodalis-like secondary symbiont of Drepanosiphum platanoidis]|uniref:tRNA (guanosine(37)-N1)-methyltransferase TrmD n=1 Tax=Sodalis-like secondary symbiont of Drepanosiphum platanoidis TaxID=2994493 RepID=UPI0034641BE7